MSAPLPEPRSPPKLYAADLFAALSIDAQHVKGAVPCLVEATPVAAKDPIDSEAQTLAEIVDLLIEMWRDASGEDLRSAFFPCRQS